MEKTYNHKKTENQIYQEWLENGYFDLDIAQTKRKKAGLETKSETFSVLMPPPNANAPLHCGHATYAIQDLMARIKRMQGYKTLYLPGTDHAGFETQVVYERHLKKEGKSRFDFDRNTLYNKILEFVKENSDVATNQLKKLGMSADWNRKTFMLDEHVIETVYDTFIKMHEDGLVYRDGYMVNYSTYHGTTFSNLETEHVEKIVPLYYVRYKVEDTEDYISVATVRPETIYADVAIAINPKDQKYKSFVGKTAINPLNGRSLPIIEDTEVDPEFGTGALKITPGHDFTDFEIGKKNKLPIITVIDLEGKMTSEAKEVEGLFPKQARKEIAKILEEKGALVRIDENYKTNLLVDYKDKLPIEPLVLPNWFIKMGELSEKAISAIKKEEVKFYQPMWKKEILRWLENIYDWPISRQTIFGIKIPAYYSIEENPDLFVVFIDKEENSHEGKLAELLSSAEFSIEEIKQGIQKVIAPENSSYKISKKPLEEGYIQETDTFDTWFSSGQWPLTTLHYPNSKEFNEFFPTDFLDTMWDILFFWVARMIMFSLYLTGKVPFKQVYIHGTITDEKGQKMSKSKGNVIDPLELVEEYGSDALRMGIIVGSNTSARTSALDINKVRGYQYFGNKIWNMARFMLMMMDQEEKSIPYFEELDKKLLATEDKEILDKFENIVKSVNKNIENYRLSLAGDEIYHFMWDELAAIYIEQVKNRKDKDVALSVLRHIYLNCLKLLHPFMPFITEEIWKEIPKKGNYPLIIAQWPTSE